MSPAATSRRPPNETAARGAPVRKVIRRARDLCRETRHLLKKKGRRAGQAAVAAVEPPYYALLELLKRRGRGTLDGTRLVEAVEALDEAVEQHFGSYRKTMLREYAEAIGWAVALALLIRSFLFEAFSIPSGSMLPTLDIGDRLFVNKIGYGLYIPFSPSRLVHWDEPERGDIIVFEFQLEGDRNDGEDYIKRVVAVAGDRVRLDDNVLYINGKAVETIAQPATECPIYDSSVDEPDLPSHTCGCVQQIEVNGHQRYMTQHMRPDVAGNLWEGCTNHPDWPLRDGVDPRPGRYYGEASENPHWPDVVVPEGHVFVMGDNRDRSEDGRYWGLVEVDQIKGTAFVVWWARDRSRMFSWLG